MVNKSPKKIKRMFNEIAPRYDFWNNIISFASHNIIKKAAIKSLAIKPNSKVLDLCSGSGDLSRIAKKIEPTIESFGLDFSEKMIAIARKKAPGTIFSIGSAFSLDYSDSCFDYILMGFGLRNIEDRKKALEEVFRVLKKGGYFLHLDFGCKNFLSRIYDSLVLFLVNLFCSNKDAYKYLIKSKQEFLEPDKLIEEFIQAGFSVKAVSFCCFKLISYQILVKN